MSERALLHARARAFITETASGSAPTESFEGLGLALARYQARHVGPYARLLEARGVDIERATTLRELPAVPTDAFRVARVAAHPTDVDGAVFLTSGTTSGLRGRHALSTTETYDAAALAWGRWGLFPDAPRPMRAVVLMPTTDLAGPDGRPGASSLGHMVNLFVRHFAREGAAVVVSAKDGGLVDLDGLLAASEEACRLGLPVVLLGTSFAFVHALDALRGRTLGLPQGSRAMHTGGTKGRSRDVDPAELREAIARAFGLAELAVVGEYGMTELSSQLYEATFRRYLGLDAATERHGWFFPPPWMRVAAVKPDGLEPLRDGEVGLLRFEDLANVDSAVAIQTADQGRIVSGGVQLLGRSPAAPPRGCSLAIEELLDTKVGA